VILDRYAINAHQGRDVSAAYNHKRAERAFTA
jgi:hypothetical protein